MMQPRRSNSQKTLDEILAEAMGHGGEVGPAFLVDKRNFEAWLAGLPESENVEDRRDEPDIRHYNHKNPALQRGRSDRQVRET